MHIGYKWLYEGKTISRVVQVKSCLQYITIYPCTADVRYSLSYHQLIKKPNNQVENEKLRANSSLGMFSWNSNVLIRLKASAHNPGSFFVFTFILTTLTLSLLRIFLWFVIYRHFVAIRSAQTPWCCGKSAAICNYQTSASFVRLTAASSLVLINKIRYHVYINVFTFIPEIGEILLWKTYTVRQTDIQ